MKFTPLMAGAMSGSMGGCVASHNRAGAYFRRRTVPTDPASTRQMAIRNIVSALSAAWLGTLTLAQREAWATYAANTPMTDTLGQTFFLTGQQAYIKCNTPRLQAMLARIDAAPTVFNNGEAVTLINTNGLNNTVNFDPPNFTLTCQFQAPLSGPATLLIYNGRLLNPTNKFFKGPYQYVGLADLADNATSVTVALDQSDAAEWKSEYVPVEGYTEGWRLRITFDDGRLSTPHDALCITTAIV